MILVANTDFIGPYAIAKSIAGNSVIDAYISRYEEPQIQKILGPELAALLIAYIATSRPDITSGSLTIGTWYKIKTYVAGDDFTNVGASSNATGVYFQATGTTPTTWTNASTLTANVVERYDNLLNPFYIENDLYTWLGEYYQRFFRSWGLKDMLLAYIYYQYLTGEQSVHSGSGVAKKDAENAKVESYTNAFRKGERLWNEQGLDTCFALYWYCKHKYPSVYPEFNGTLDSPAYTAVI